MGGFSFSSVPRPRTPLRRLRLPLRPFFLPLRVCPCVLPSHTPHRTRLNLTNLLWACFAQYLVAIGWSYLTPHPCLGLALGQFVDSRDLIPSSTGTISTSVRADGVLRILCRLDRQSWRCMFYTGIVPEQVVFHLSLTCSPLSFYILDSILLLSIASDALFRSILHHRLDVLSLGSA